MEKKQHYVQLLTSRPCFKHLQPRFASWVVGKKVAPKNLLPNGVVFFGVIFIPWVGDESEQKHADFHHSAMTKKTYSSQPCPLGRHPTSICVQPVVTAPGRAEQQNSIGEIETGRATGHYLLKSLV